MPWNKDHKGTTRGRILETASSALRAKGVAGVGVAQVMQEAGLTHGGFYAHFGSKDELVADAFLHACDQSAGKLEAAAGAAAEGEKLNAVASAYLTSNHARHPERGCPIAALGGELVRNEGPARAPRQDESAHLTARGRGRARSRPVPPWSQSGRRSRRV